MNRRVSPGSCAAAKDGPLAGGAKLTFGDPVPKHISLSNLAEEPGEKLTEELWNDDEEPVPSPVPGILVAAAPLRAQAVDPFEQSRLFRSAASGDVADVVRALIHLIPEYTPSMTALSAACGEERPVTDQGAPESAPGLEKVA